MAHTAPLEKLAGGCSVEQARRLITDVFRRAQLDSPELEARLIVGHALALDHARLVSAAHEPINEIQAQSISNFAARRLAREPMARIAGVKEFWGMPFLLSAETLVPRPETETVVESALAVLPPDAPLRMLDLGAGTGALLLALLRERPKMQGVATDLSIEALSTAQRNARALGLAERAHFVACDLGAALRGPFDCVVSNPPYIATAAIRYLEYEVRDHDPHLALDGGKDGLDAYRAIALQARSLIAPGGHLIVEIGLGQEGPVLAIMEARGLIPKAPTRLDLAGIPRALTLGRG